MNAGVRAWSADVDAAELGMSVISLKELEVGILVATKRNPNKALQLRAWLDHLFLPGMGDRIFPVDRAIALQCAQLTAEADGGLADMLIASTALVLNLTLVSRNVRDMQRTGVPLLNPFT